MKHTHSLVAVLSMFILYLIQLLIPSNAVASVGQASGAWKSYVSPSLISEIIQSGDELLMATSGGLLIYDLNSSRFSQITNISGLQSNSLTCAEFNNSGELFVGTSDAGIAKIIFNSGKVNVVSFNSAFHGLADDRVTSLASWGDTLVYGTEAGAGIIVSDFPLVRYYQRDGLPGEHINDLLVDGDKVFFATIDGVGVLNKQGFITDFSSGLPSVDVKVLARVDSSVYAGTAGGLAKFNYSDSTWSLAGLPGKNIFSLHYDDSLLWAGSNDSLFVFDGSSWMGYSLVPTFSSYRLSWVRTEIRSILKASDGKIYIGLGDWRAEGRGCYLVSLDETGSFENLVPNSIAENSVLRLSVDLDGSLWASTTRFGISKLNPSGTWVNYNNTTPGGDNLSWRFQNLALLADSKGTKWFGAITYLPQSPLDELDDGLNDDFADDKWSHHSLGSGGGDGLGTLRFINAMEDPTGNRWFLSDDFYKDQSPRQWGISILSNDGSEWLQVNPTSTNDGMKSGNVLDVAFSLNGDVYVGLRYFGVQKWITGGLDKANLFDLSDDIWITIGRIGGQGEFSSEADILSLAARRDGVLWVGTTSGLYKYRNGSFKLISANRGVGTGLLGNQIIDLLLDEQENLWVATDLGLNRIARDNDSDILSFTTAVAWQTSLNLFFPLDVVSPLVNAFCNALALDNSGNRLFVATSGGLSEFDVSTLQPAANDLKKVYVYPNPIRASKGDTSLKIANINSPVIVQIFNVEGELVHRQQAMNGNDVIWDFTTEEGFLAASGIYLVHISDENGSIVKTISLLR